MGSRQLIQRREHLTDTNFCLTVATFATSEKVREYPGNHSVWILDGASIHCDKNISHYLRSLGIYTIYLPAYCPFYNPIEIVFGNIKSHLRRNYIENISFAEMNIFVAQTLIDFTSKSARKIFSKCGYVRSGFFDPVKAFVTTYLTTSIIFRLYHMNHSP